MNCALVEPFGGDFGGRLVGNGFDQDKPTEPDGVFLVFFSAREMRTGEFGVEVDVKAGIIHACTGEDVVQVLLHYPGAAGEEAQFRALQENLSQVIPVISRPHFRGRKIA